MKKAAIIFMVLFYAMTASALQMRSRLDPRMDPDDSPTFVDLILTGGNITSASSINLKPSGDADDYWSFSTVNDVPTLNPVGGFLVKIKTDSTFAALDIWNTNDKGISAFYGGTTGTLTSTDNLSVSADSGLLRFLATDTIRFQANGDNNDFVEISTVANVPTITGNDELVISTDNNGDITLSPDGTGETIINSDIDITGVATVQGLGTGGQTDYDLKVGDTDGIPTYGMIQMGNSCIGRTSFAAGNIDLDGSMIYRNIAGPVTSEIEHVFVESTGDSTRFALPKSAVGNATYNSRSMLIAGPAPADTDYVKVTYWRTNNNIFDNLACDTSGTGADLGVQNDIEVEGDIFVDSIKESTTDAGITFNGFDVLGVGSLMIDGVFTDGNYTFDDDGNVSGLGTVGCGSITAIGSARHVLRRSTAATGGDQNIVLIVRELDGAAEADTDAGARLRYQVFDGGVAQNVVDVVAAFDGDPDNMDGKYTIQVAVGGTPTDAVIIDSDLKATLLGDVLINGNIIGNDLDITAGTGDILTTGTLGAGAITGTSLTDGTATLSGGNLTAMVSVTSLSAISYNITAVSIINETFAFQPGSDVSSQFPVGSQFTVGNSTGNDGTWTVSIVAWSSPNLTITVKENITDATVDGDITSHGDLDIAAGTGFYEGGNAEFTLAGGAAGSADFRVDGNTNPFTTNGSGIYNRIALLATNDGAYTSGRNISAISFTGLNKATFSGTSGTSPVFSALKSESVWDGDFEVTGQSKTATILTHRAIRTFAGQDAVWKTSGDGELTAEHAGGVFDSTIQGTLDESGGALIVNQFGGIFRFDNAVSAPTIIGTPIINYVAGEFDGTARASYLGAGTPVATSIGGRFTAANGDTNIGIEVNNVSGGTFNFAMRTGTGLVQFGGDTIWVGDGTGLPYGHMYVDGTQTIIVALTLNTPTEVEDDGTTSAEDGWLAGDLNLITFPTGGTEHYITITKAGTYHINWNLSFKMVTAGANTQIHGGLVVDGTPIRDKCEAHRTISTNVDVGNMAGSCTVDLPNGNEELSLWMENTTNNNDAEVDHGSLVAVMVGGT